MLSKLNLRCKSVIASIVLSSWIVSQPASADTLKYLGPAFGGYISTSGLTNTVPPPAPVTTSPNAGAVSVLNLTAGGSSFAAWCVDISRWLDTSPSGASYTLMSGTSLFSSSQVTALERLASNNLASIASTALSGAFQLAVWEIVNETSGTYDLRGGNFYLASASGTAIDTANEWLKGLGSDTPTMVLSIWESSKSQDLAVFNVSAIPEPEIYAMLLAGFGLIGFVAKRRRQAIAAS